MCGIAGATTKLLGENHLNILEKMNDVMMHRGPDMGNLYHDNNMSLCHRRLSIIDLSEDGCQPMESQDGRYVIVFNGEIYNFLDLRKQLIKKGYSFRSRTDTEVLLVLYSHYGPSLLQKIRGMFAFAIWDKKDQLLFAACDRIGKKPIYYYEGGNHFAFASEIKSLSVIPGIKKEIDYSAVLDFFAYLYIPHPKSIFHNIRKLSPGHYLIYYGGAVSVKKYWDIDFSNQLSESSEQISEELSVIIKEAVNCRLVADVPLGAFLSGGIDSSGVVAMMASGNTNLNPLMTCSIGFKDSSHNEARHAKQFAKKIKSNHKEKYIFNEPEEILRKLVWHCDEPFADSSMVPTYYVSKMAKQYVTVALSGDGGDESFGGYDKYVKDIIESWVRDIVPIPVLLIAKKISDCFQFFGPMKRINTLVSSAMMDHECGLFVTNSFIRTRQLNALFQSHFLKKIGGYDPAEHIRTYYRNANGEDHLSKILYTDLKLFLPGDILTKVDRMSMANSLEVRSPLLDHNVIEFAAKIPSKMKIRNGKKKIVLKNTFRPLVGTDVIKRPKHGFTVPLDSWFRNELYNIAKQSLFHSEYLEYFVSPKALSQLWVEHQSKKFNHGTLLWSMLIFSLWLEISA